MARTEAARPAVAPGRRVVRKVALAVALLLTGGFVFAACGTTEPNPPDTTVPTEPTQDPRVEEAIEDLAERQDTDPAAIEAGPLETVTWSDGSLGCPEEGMGYTQALVDGYRLELTIQGEVFAYHGDAEGELFWCTDPVQPVDSAPADLVDMD